jgi:hypothetical protein
VASPRENPHQQRAFEDALRRVLDLPPGDVAAVYERVRGHLSELGTPPDPVSRVVRERMEALAALAAAADHLKLPAGEAPTVRQYTEAREELGLQLSSRQIQYRWGMWREAGNALTGKRTTETPEQLAARRPSGSRGGGPPNVELPLAALRAWLTSKPRPAREYTTDYKRWRQRANQGRARADLYPAATTVLAVLLVPWEVAVDLARPGSKLDLTTCRETYMQQLKEQSGPFGLCNITGVALAMNATRPDVERLANARELPPPVAVLSQSRVWRWTDAEAFAANRSFVFEHDEGQLQAELMDQDELARLLQGKRTHQQSKDRIRNALGTGRPTVPPPAGWFGQEDRYWLRETVSRWCRDNPELVRASSQTLFNSLRGSQRTSVAKRPGHRV